MAHRSEPSSEPYPSALEFLPKSHTLPALRKAAQACKGCPLYSHATQAVFGEGATNAEIILIGEQPGDHEDIEGKPFVGPAGNLLDKCLEDAGIERSQVFITNAVKHFKWEPRGKRRLHKKPTLREIAACRPWLDAEIETVQPRLLICLGATAAQGLLGKKFLVTKHRGEIVELENYPPITATIHPSAILRAPDDESRHRERAQFIEDLKVAARHVSRSRRRAETH